MHPKSKNNDNRNRLSDGDGGEGPREDHLAGYRAVVGLDWADNKHDICLLDLSSNRSEQITVKHEVDALVEFINRLRAEFVSSEGGADHGASEGKVAIVIEQKRGAMINFLLGLDFIEIFPIDPAKLSSFRKAIYPSGRKNDVIDSELAVEYFVKHGRHLGNPWKPDTSEMRELGFLTEDRRELIDERTKCVQRLGAALKQYYPLALELFEDLGSDLTCRFLKKWPSFEALRRARKDTVRRFFYANNSRSGKKIEQRLEAIGKAKALTGDQAVIAAMSRRVKVLAEEILLKNPAIKAYQKRIAELYNQATDAFIYESLPGAGEALEPRLMVVFGTDRTRYEAPGNITEYTGVAPVTQESGESKKTKHKNRKVKFRRGAPTFQRQTMVEFAGSSVRYCPWANAYYRLKESQGQKRQTILRGLAIKWTRIIFRCWRNNEPYDEQRYIAALKKKGSPLWGIMQETAIP